MIKLGFGSSATTVVSIVTLLLLESHSITRLLVEGERELISCLSRKAHNTAQGRVGSGFDVVTAVFGSCVFERKGSECVHSPFHLPSSVSIALSCGNQSSSTPILIRRVEKWRQREEAKRIWKEYAMNNASIVQVLREGSDMKELKRLYEEKLEIMHSISRCSNSGIVPDELYTIIKETLRLRGVIGCAVAGAGGFDSFYCLYDSQQVRPSQLESIWSQAGCQVSSIVEGHDGLIISFPVCSEQTDKNVTAAENFPLSRVFLNAVACFC